MRATGETRDDTAPESRALLRLTFAYLGVFLVVITALSIVAFESLAANYRSIVAPALDTIEGRRALDAALRPAIYALLSIDAVLVFVVGGASYGLARLALRPLLRAREQQERFSADMAHELRTPLGAIASVAQAARADATGEAAAAFDAIVRRALDLGSLVSDLLTLETASDPDALACEPVDLAMLARAIASDASLRCSDVDLRLVSESAIVLGDERRLRQLVRNLVDNALAHARSRAEMRVAVGEGSATISIEDDGPGVDRALASRLFERFAHGTDSRGSGLGLAICRWVSRAHGGSIAYEGGSRFVVTLPTMRAIDRDS